MCVCEANKKEFLITVILLICSKTFVHTSPQHRHKLMALCIGLSNHPDTHTHTPTHIHTHTRTPHFRLSISVRQEREKTQIRFYIFNCQSSSQFLPPPLPSPDSPCVGVGIIIKVYWPPAFSTPPHSFLLPSSSAGLVFSFYFISAQINLLFSYVSLRLFTHENSKVKIPLAP